MLSVLQNDSRMFCAPLNRFNTYNASFSYLLIEDFFIEYIVTYNDLPNYLLSGIFLILSTNKFAHT